MSHAARDWVWTRSASRGAVRLVLLAVAEHVVGADCVAYAGTTRLVHYTGAARSTVRAAVDSALASGELVVVDGRVGPRGETVYLLPHAVGHVPGMPDSTTSDRADHRPGSESGPGRESAPGGPTTGPVGDRESARGVPESGPQNREHEREEKKQSSSVAELRPLAEQLAADGMGVTWTLTAAERADVLALVARHGVPELVAHVRARWNPARPPRTARYLLRMWADLGTTTAPSTPAASAPPGDRSLRPTHTNTLAGALALLHQEGHA
ncbi:hypothetical protein [Embleya sp. MST-111070]|uniref:hypothetical protein n=1 Tax=Embleya sp. MST-111070 TaxID=3398231 RepID=UPI003F74061A